MKKPLKFSFSEKRTKKLIIFIPRSVYKMKMCQYLYDILTLKWALFGKIIYFLQNFQSLNTLQRTNLFKFLACSWENDTSVPKSVHESFSSSVFSPSDCFFIFLSSIFLFFNFSLIFNFFVIHTAWKASKYGFFFWS